MTGQVYTFLFDVTFFNPGQGSQAGTQARVSVGDGTYVLNALVPNPAYAEIDLLVSVRMRYRE